MAGERCCDRAGRALRYAPYESEIIAGQGHAAAVIGKDRREPPVRRIALGNDEQARCILVEPMDDARPLDPADAREAGAAMGDEPIDQRARRMARRRMDHQSRRLVENDEMLVLEADRKRHDFAAR